MFRPLVNKFYHQMMISLMIWKKNWTEQIKLDCQTLLWVDLQRLFFFFARTYGFPETCRWYTAVIFMNWYLEALTQMFSLLCLKIWANKCVGSWKIVENAQSLANFYRKKLNLESFGMKILGFRCEKFRRF